MLNALIDAHGGRYVETKFVNLSNHPSSNWDATQRQAAEQYGAIVDVPFPAVPAGEDEAYIRKLSDELVQKVMQYQPGAVLCQGEFTLAYSVIRTLKARGVCVLAACSERNVVTHGNTKQVVFRFERFREYMDN